MCDLVRYFSIAANECQTAVIPIGTAAALIAKVNGAAHIVAR
jgi:hypothetical protein